MDSLSVEKKRKEKPPLKAICPKKQKREKKQ